MADDRKECQCPICGRTHWHLGNPGTLADKPGVNYEAWARTLIGFIRSKGLEDECKDWCGGWPCPIERPYVTGTASGYAKRALKRVT